MENQMVYKQNVDYARQNGEFPHYRDSNWLNEACAQAIDRAIKDSNGTPYHYDLSTAAQKVVAEYGTERVSWVLAASIQNLEHDGRFSRDNKEWAKGINIPAEETRYYLINTHPAILDGFINAARKWKEEA